MTYLFLPETVEIDTDDSDAFTAYQAAVNLELQALIGMSVYQKRRNTVWHLAWASVTPQISQNDVFKRKDCISKSTYYNKEKDWSTNPDFRAVLERVTALTRAYVEGKDGRALERQRAQLRELEWELATGLFEKAKNMLEFPLKTTVTSTEETKDSEGRIISIHHTTINEPTNWRQRDAAQLADKGSTIGRRSSEMTKDKNALEFPDLGQLTDSELDDLARDV